MPYKVEPVTPEGRLIRAARTRKHLTLPDAAELTGMGGTKYGILERGYDNDGTRERKRPEDDDLAVIAQKLGIPAEALDEIGRHDAAALLRGFPAPPPAEERRSLEESVDELFVALSAALADARARAGDRPDTVIQRLWWRSYAPDGRPKPVEQRIGDVVTWLGKSADGEARSAENLG